MTTDRRMKRISVQSFKSAVIFSEKDDSGSKDEADIRSILESFAMPDGLQPRLRRYADA